MARRGLRQEEHRLEIHVDDRIPVGLGEIDGVVAANRARVVDEDVQATEFSNDFGDHGGVIGFRPEIRLDPHTPTPQRLYCGKGFGRVAAPDGRDIGARTRQRFGDGATDSSVRACDGGNAPAQIEAVIHRSTFIGTQATSLYSWFSPPIAQMKL